MTLSRLNLEKERFIYSKVYIIAVENMRIPKMPSRLIELIEDYKREDGSVGICVKVASMDVRNEVAKRLSQYGEVVRISKYGPFLNLVLPDVETADGFVKEYDSSKQEGTFKDVVNIEVPAFYKAAGTKFY